jgi:hypothetical protein
MVMSKRFISAICVVVLVVAVAAVALAAADQPPAPQSAAQPAGMYHVKLACYNDDQLIMESEIAVLGGVTADISDTRMRATGVEFSGLVQISAPNPCDPEIPIYVEHKVPPAILDAAQQFECAGLCFAVYCPGADRFEAEVSWGKPSGIDPTVDPNVSPMKIIEQPESEWVFLDCICAELCTPDVGIVDPGNYMQQLNGMGYAGHKPESK